MCVPITKGLAENQYIYQTFNLNCTFTSKLHYTLYVISLPAETPIAPAIIGTHGTANMAPRDGNGGMMNSTMPITSRRHPRTIRVIPETIQQCLKTGYSTNQEWDGYFVTSIRDFTLLPKARYVYIVDEVYPCCYIYLMI